MVYNRFFRFLTAQNIVEAYAQHSNMNSIGQGGSLSNGGREAAGRGPGRLGSADNKISAPRDHPMLQTGNQSQEVKKTHYPYKEPRIDQRMYQAEIPRLQGRASNRAVTRGSSSPRAGETCTMFCGMCLKYLPYLLAKLTAMSNASRRPRYQVEVVSTRTRVDTDRKELAIKTACFFVFPPNHYWPARFSNAWTAVPCVELHVR